MDSLSKDSAFDDQMEDPRGRGGAHPFDHDQMDSLSKDSAFDDQTEDPREGAPTHLIMIKWIVYPRIPHLMIKWGILRGGRPPI